MSNAWFDRRLSLQGLRALLSVGLLSVAFQSCGGEVRVGRTSSAIGDEQGYGLAPDGDRGDGDGDGTGGSGSGPGSGDVAIGGASPFDVFGFYSGSHGFFTPTDYRLGRVEEAINWETIDEREPWCDIPRVCERDPRMVCIGDCPPMVHRSSELNNLPIADLLATLDGGVALRTGMFEAYQEGYGLGELWQLNSQGALTFGNEAPGLRNSGAMAEGVDGVFAATLSAEFDGLQFTGVSADTETKYLVHVDVDDFVGLPEGGFLLTGDVKSGFLPDEDTERSGPVTLWWGEGSTGERTLLHKADVAGQLTAVGGRVFLTPRQYSYDNEEEQASFSVWRGDAWTAVPVPFAASDDSYLFRTVDLTSTEADDPLFVICDVRSNTDQRCRLSLRELNEVNQLQDAQEVGELPLELHSVVGMGKPGKLVVEGRALLVGAETCYETAIIQLDLATRSMDWAILASGRSVIDQLGRLVIASTVDLTEECEGPQSGWDGNHFRMQLTTVEL